MNTTYTSVVREFPEYPATAVEAIEGILAYAASLGCSDIHVDPSDKHTIVRVRIDGTIEVAGIVAKRLHDEMISRLKILSGARTDLHALPQDGRWKTDILGRTYNVRISFMPTYHGENAVLRLLPTDSVNQISFAKLGFTPDIVNMIDRALQRTHGLILVTGPTGSGKTTTLHSCLALKSREPLSIITLEDPVEYEIAGIRQIHIRHTHGLTFAHGLRASLRQDPDVIMVGEIRDSETAKVAIHTALTGHLVLSTLHTNSALDAIPRLIDMGVDAYLLASTLKVVIAQRLVRKVCDECNGGGCTTCRMAGYIGRLVIAEAYEVDEEMQKLLIQKASVAMLQEYVNKKGFRNLADDGREKIEWGVTTQEEVLRVLSE